MMGGKALLKRPKTAVCIALIGLLCILTCLIQIACRPADVPFYLEYESESGAEQYSCWRGENQKCYLFLPGYVDLSQSRIVMNTGDQVYLEGEALGEHTDCSQLQENWEYEMTYRGIAVEERLSLTILRSGEVPVVHIDTESGDMAYIHAGKGNEEKANIRIYSAEGVLTCHETLKSIAARGNSTFGEEKKPYTIQFTEPENVFGMGEAEKWILLANAFDLTNLRNHLVLESAPQMGLAYTPDAQWVELYLNREYAGLYQLCEKNEINANRVDIPQQDSFLFSLEDRGRIVTQNLPHYETKNGQVIRIRHPEVLTESDEEKLALLVQRAENAIMSEDGIDPDSGAAWDEVIDVDSWARKYLIEEIFANIDAGKWSQYFHIKGDGETIYAGPVWDYDLSAAISWQTSMTNAWYCNRLSPNAERISPWFDALSRKPEFMQRVVQIYMDEALPVMDELINNGIQQSEKIIAQSNIMNGIRWNRTSEPEGEVWRIENYLRERIRFLNDIWIEKTEYVDVVVYLGETNGYVNLSIAAGTPLNKLPELPEDDFFGWYHSADGTPVTPEQKVEADMQIYAVRGKTYAPSDRAIKLIPLGVIAMMGIVIAIVEFCRLKSRRWHDV